VDICTFCNAPRVLGCDGLGRLQGSADDSVKQCLNIYARQLKDHLGTEIASVPHVTSSPLLQLSTDGSPPIVDLTNDNIHIRSTWPALLPHLKWVLGVKGLLFYYRIVTDLKIKTVFVGSDSYKARPASMREDVMTFNSLEDLVGSDQHLVIVKLGYLGHKNVAAAGALKEALMLRDAARKPTWIFEDLRDGYEWKHSHSQDVEEYIQRMFKVVTIEPDGRCTIDIPDSNDETVSGITVDDDTPLPPPRRRAPEPEVVASSSEDDISLPGANSKKKFKKRWT